MAKRVRFIIALALLATLYIAFSGPTIPAITPVVRVSSQEAERPSHHISLSESDDASEEMAGPPPELLKDAHELVSADDFLSHFKAVIELPGITLEEAKLTCTWTDKDHVHFQFSDDEQSWLKYERHDHELSERREQWRSFVKEQMITWSSAKDRFSSRGIVVVAGNEESLTRLAVLLGALAKLGTKLPVEVHYWDDELSENDKTHLVSLWSDLTFNDLSDDHQLVGTSHGIFTNYQLKTAAVVNSRFEEVLLLDSDNIPVLDPLELFNSDLYQEYGTIFWPDITRTRPSNPAWSISNTRCRMDEYEQDSGQLMVDKRRYFYHLQLAAWLNNEHSNYYNEFLLSDKDFFRFSWHMLKTPFGAPKKWVTSVGTENDGFYCGHSFAQHHPNGSIAFLHGGLLKTMDLSIMRHNLEKKGGIFQKYKRSKYDERPDLVELVGIKWDGGSYMPDKQKPQQVAHCMDMETVQARDLEELLPGIQSFYKDIGGYWMLEGD